MSEKIITRRRLLKSAGLVTAGAGATVFGPWKHNRVYDRQMVQFFLHLIRAQEKLNHLTIIETESNPGNGGESAVLSAAGS